MKKFAVVLAATLLSACQQVPFLPTPGAVNGGGASGERSPVEGAPIINAISTSPSNLVKGQPVTFDVKATDPSGKPLEYRWGSSKGVLSATTGQLISWHPPAEDGVYAVQVVVANSDGKATSASINLIVEGNGIKEEAPVIAPPGQDLPMLSDRVVAVIGGDIALVDYQNPGEPAIYLTQNTLAESAPDLSPDRTRVTYLRDGKLCVLPIGGRPFLLDQAPDCEAPTWSPDGRQVLYGKDRTTGDFAYQPFYKVYSAEGKVGAIPGLRVGYNARLWGWRSDGEIAYVKKVSYASYHMFVGADPLFETETYGFAADKNKGFAAQLGHLKQGISTTSMGKISDNQGIPFAYHDGLVYTIEDEAIVSYDEVSGSRKVLAGGVAKDSKAALSEDGKTVVYVGKNRDPRVGTDASQLFAVSTAGGGSRQVTFEATGVSDPSF